MSSRMSSQVSPQIRKAKLGDESEIHESHMRSIREVCVTEHGSDEIKGWGNRELGSRWTNAIRDGHVWVVTLNKKIYGLGYIRIYDEAGSAKAEIHGLYLTPEVLKQGYGKKLANLMIQKAKEHKVRQIVLSSSLTAHKFYERLGFVDQGPRRQVEIGGSLVSGYPMMLEVCCPSSPTAQ